MRRKMGFWPGYRTAILGQQGTVVWGPRGGEKGSSTEKLAGLCGVAGWVVGSGEAGLQSLAAGDEI